MVGAIVKLVSVLQNIQTVWNMLAGTVTENKELAGQSIYALGGAVDWFQSTTFPPIYDVRQPTQKSELLGRISGTYYKSAPNNPLGNSYIYTGVFLEKDFFSNGKNYKGEIVYVRSVDAGIRETPKTTSKSNFLFYGALAFLGYTLLTEK